MTAQEIAAYWQELAKKAGVPEERVKAVVEALSDETVSKAFAEGFLTQPEYNRGLDKNKSEWESKVQEASAQAVKLNDWYEKEAKPAYEQNLHGIDTLKKYQELYGALDGTGDSKTNGDPPKDVLTRTELNEELRKRDQNVVDLTKTAMRISSDYTNRFKEPMSEEKLNELEKLAVDNSIPLGKAYEMWIAPRVNTMEREALEAKYEKKTVEAVADALSQHNLPVGSAAPEYHPFFNRDKVEGELSEVDKRSRSKEAFTKGWNEQGAA